MEALLEKATSISAGESPKLVKCGWPLGKVTLYQDRIALDARLEPGEIHNRCKHKEAGAGNSGFRAFDRDAVSGGTLYRRRLGPVGVPRWHRPANLRWLCAVEDNVCDYSELGIIAYVWTATQGRPCAAGD